VLLAALFAFYSVRLAWVSYSIHDISTSNDATPLWIPQLAMAVGTVILLLAFADEWVREVRGARRTVESAEALHHE
jgi:TRAP-type C4-dicarboxylate transport system permease small subunit